MDLVEMEVVVEVVVDLAEAMEVAAADLEEEVADLEMAVKVVEEMEAASA